MPQIYLEKVNSFCNAEIFFWHIEESREELSELIADNGISLDEAQERFKSSSRQREWLAARTLLRHTPYKDEKIIYHSNGKPCFANSNKHISISHTTRYVVIAIADNPVGIDIEWANRNALSVTKSFLQLQEMDILSQSDSPNQEALTLWSAKESAFKLASDKVTVLKDIQITKNEVGYTVTYPDGTTAICYIQIVEDIILSIAMETH